jgi:hypothetical protein
MLLANPNLVAADVFRHRQKIAARPIPDNRTLGRQWP